MTSNREEDPRYNAVAFGEGFSLTARDSSGIVATPAAKP